MIKKLTILKTSSILDLITLFAIIGVIFSFPRNLLGVGVSVDEGDQVAQIVLITGFTISLLLFYIVHPLALKMNLIKVLVGLLIFWVMLSALWSEYWSITLRRGIALVITIGYSYLLVWKYTSLGILKLFGIVFAIILIGSLIVVILLPEHSIMSFSFENGWKGMFVHKNHLGRFSAYGTLIYIFLIKLSKNFSTKLIYVFFLLLACFLLFMSRSTTGYILFFLSIVMIIIIHAFNSLRSVWITLVILFFIFFAFTMNYLFQNLDIFTEWFGKDATLSGRTILWQSLVEIGKQKTFGYGYGAFWLIPENTTSQAISSMTRWNPTHGHNGYLDVWLQLGWPGILMVVSIIIIVFGKLISFHITEKNETPVWLVSLVFLLIINFVESNLLIHNNFFTMLFFLVCFQTTKIILHKTKDMIEGNS